VNILFKNDYTLIFKYIYKTIKYFVMRNVRGTCLSFKMLKGYMVNPALIQCKKAKPGDFTL